MTRNLLIFFCLLIAISGFGVDAGRRFPLYDIAIKDSIDLSGEWKFKSDPDDVGTTNSWFNLDVDRADWKTVTVPGVWDCKPGEIQLPIPSCVGWFHQQVQVPGEWGEDIAIAFLGSMYITDVWVDGQYAGVHRGGYSPFSFDLTKLVKPGKMLSLVVRVDNRLSLETVPGKNMGWQFFGGLCREVYLLHKPRIRPESIETAVTIQSDSAARLRLAAILTNGTDSAYTGSLTVELVNPEKKQSAATTNVPASCAAQGAVKIQAELTVDNARLWSPEDPFLYTLTMKWGQNHLAFPVGLREIKVENGKFLLNNRRYWLQGFGHHEEYGLDGPCFSAAKRLAELKLMKDAYKCNAIRPGHYPNHPDLYNLCDELGLLVFSEIPAWQNKSDFLQSDKAWEIWLEPQLREMVRTLRNHPSVFAWAISNEIGGTHAYFQHALDYVRGLDDTRQATLVLAATADLESIKFLGLVARNFHYGWYHSKSVYALREGLAENVKTAVDKPIWVAELGAHANLGNLKGGYGDDSRGSEPYQDKMIRFGLQYVSTESDLIMGVSVWTWTDFHRNSGPCPHGILDEKREPKIAAYTVCNLYRNDLRLYVCETNSRCLPDTDWVGSLRCLNVLQQERKGLKAVWRILAGDKQLATGEIAFDMTAARSKEIGEVRWRLPKDSPPTRYTFWVELFDADGKWLYTNSSLFDCVAQAKPEEPPFSGLLKVKALDNGRPLDNAWIMLQGVHISVYSFPGLIMPLAEGTYTIEIKADGREARTRKVSIKTAESTEVVVDFALKEVQQ